ncbi:MAG TPA: GNAT family N-acetyltransferase [Fibrobacteria bacterium]|nr:GNAT family N-acetyltransferase [Fibrobacteria bacterium]
MNIDRDILCEPADLVLEAPVRNRSAEPLSVRLFPRESKDALRDKWREMEAVSEHTFFTCWDWISGWLDTVSAQILQCEVHAGEELVGLGLFVERRERRMGLIPFRRLFLHRTGEHALDRMCIEWNDLLIRPGFEEGVRRSLVEVLTREPRGADEVVFGYTPEGHDRGVAGPGFVSRIGYTQASPWVDLARVRAEGGFDNTLSHKTRANVRKSLRKAEALGRIELRSAATAGEALDFFREAGPYHIERWKNGKPGRQSGYLNPTFLAFHERLIPVAFDHGRLDFVKVTAGGVLLAYMYFFVYRKVVHFYQSVVNFAGLENGQPGLIANYLCIQKFAEQDLEKYDFLAGDSQYKRVLATDTATQMYFHYRKRSLKMGMVERYLAWKHKSQIKQE